MKYNISVPSSGKDSLKDIFRAKRDENFETLMFLKVKFNPCDYFFGGGGMIT
jgi:hypothetical protein